MPDQPSQPLDSNQETSGVPAPPTLSEKLREQPSLTTKSRHIGERVIEIVIRVVAGLSIVFIFLIFFFIFREASPILFGPSDDKHTAFVADDYRLPGDTARSADTSSNEMERYGEDTADLPNIPTTSGGESTDTTGTGGEMESYGDTTGLPQLPGTSGGTPMGTDGKKGIDTAKAIEVIGKDYPILTHESPVKMSHLFFDVWQPNSEYPRYGIYPILLGTLKTTIVALLIGAPLAILAALYTAFFAPKRLREIIKPIIELLAGFPSVVIGFFCLMTVASIVQSIFGTEVRLNAVVGGIGLSLAVIPIIYTITDDALRAIPLSLREAALALGASEWQAAYQVMLPAATPGIFAALLLGLGRAFGETMIALMATGNANNVDWNFFESVRTLAATIGAEMGEVVFGSPHYQVLFMLGVLLFIFSFVINFVTEFYVKQRLIKKFRGAA